MNPAFWIRIAEVIEQRYEQYDGFVVLHGTDTMAFTASVLSFLLEHLNKPVVFTGSQLPLVSFGLMGEKFELRQLRLQPHVRMNTPIVPEVSLYF
jgi:L-asparaginase